MLTLPAAALPRRPAAALLAAAARELAAAAEISGSGGNAVNERYVSAHLAALRAAAAVLAARAHPAPPGGRRSRPENVWTLLTRVAPEFGEWAAFFAASASKRAVAETGQPHAITAREADDLVRDASTFLELVSAALARPAQIPLPLPGADRGADRRIG
ncbi:MAG: SAV_6107 family HEPN domain-containing protein [Mycobacteriales bacterium]